MENINTIKEDEVSFRGIVETAYEGIWQIDKNAFTIFVNDSMAAMFGYKKEEMIGKHLFDFMDNKNINIAKKKLKKRKDGSREQYEFEFLHKSGKPIYTLVGTTPLYDLDGAYDGVVAFVSNITRLKILQEKLITKEKLSVLGQLAGGVAHDLRNPLTAIKNASYFLNMAIEKPEPDIKKTLEVLDKGVESSEEIISNILSFANHGTPIKKKVNVGNILKDIITQTTLPDSIKVTNSLDGSLPAVTADPGQITRVFSNIIQNAVQAM